MEINSTMLMLGAIALFALLVLGFFAIVFKKGSKLNQKFYINKWNKIEELAGSEAGWTSAIVEADKLLDDALKKSGYKGKTMGERLVSASRAFSDKDRTWAAHKIRNKVVHESSFKLRKNHVDGSLKAFRKSLKDLGAL